MVRPYMLWPWAWIATSFPKARAKAACLHAYHKLGLLRAVDAFESDVLRVCVVQDFEGVAIEDAPSP